MSRPSGWKDWARKSLVPLILGVIAGGATLTVSLDPTRKQDSPVREHPGYCWVMENGKWKLSRIKPGLNDLECARRVSGA